VADCPDSRARQHGAAGLIPEEDELGVDIKMLCLFFMYTQNKWRGE